MKRSFVVTLVALGGIACHRAPSQQAEPAQKPAAAAAASDPWASKPVAKNPLKRPMFWSAEKDGKTTYFLGTMHIGIDAESQLPQLVWDKLDAAPVFAMETDPADPSILGIGRRDDGKTLRDDLGEEYWKKLSAQLEPRELDAVNRMKPMIAATILETHGLPKVGGMDTLLHGRALNEKKDIVYLEPATKQAALLEKWMDIRSVKMMLDEPAKGVEMAKAMVDAYVSGDEKKIVELSDSQKADQLAHGYTAAEYDQSMEEMLYERNASWIDAIEKMHARGNGFVAVGALHLVGKRSVLDLLAAKGYKVTRLTP